MEGRVTIPEIVKGGGGIQLQSFVHVKGKGGSAILGGGMEGSFQLFGLRGRKILG